MIKNFIHVEPHQTTQMQICPVHHGSKRGIQHTQFAGNPEISVTSQGLFHIQALLASKMFVGSTVCHPSKGFSSLHLYIIYDISYDIIRNL
jgi:hypothetical protein